ncbi:hypothetical protein TWF694_009347 [Orbilia ellipsospora]|uniref:Uncharacterized protein n=1 Tax=Orbilia ellipsospora TaxID=2528407 RepID=A0AAV9XF30_9PEZI
MAGSKWISKGRAHQYYSPLYQASAVDDDDLNPEEYGLPSKLLSDTSLHTVPPRNLLRGSMSSFIFKLWVFLLGLGCTKVFQENSSRNTPSTYVVSNEPKEISYRITRGLDIVVSHYSEDLESLNAFMSGLESIPKLNDLKPNLIIYTKNNASDISKIKDMAGASEVIVLPNEGREAATYFHHIIQRWDDLANHTLFIQADPHTPDRALGRLRSYFEPGRTGMLDLGFRDLRTCNCLDCIDAFGWADEARLIPDLMAKAHHVQCDKDTKVSISYKGQFIVSAKRTRSVQKSLYESLNSKLVGDHRIILGGDEDRLDAPVLGYTLERAWNVLFQCADQTGVRDMCPGLTLTSGAFLPDFRKPQPEDCGCLDT